MGFILVYFTESGRETCFGWGRNTSQIQWLLANYFDLQCVIGVTTRDTRPIYLIFNPIQNIQTIHNIERKTQVKVCVTGPAPQLTKGILQ